MELSIIYSIDTPREVSIVQFNPPKNQKRLWQLTENDSGYEFGYLEGRRPGEAQEMVRHFEP